MNCRVGKMPFVYLGLPINGDARRLSFWDHVVTRIVTRLSGWKSRFLYFGGCLILIKYVMYSLPIYVLSFFKAPSRIISSIESLFNIYIYIYIYIYIILFFWVLLEATHEGVF